MSLESVHCVLQEIRRDPSNRASPIVQTLRHKIKRDVIVLIVLLDGKSMHRRYLGWDLLLSSNIGISARFFVLNLPLKDNSDKGSYLAIPLSSSQYSSCQRASDFEVFVPCSCYNVATFAVNPVQCSALDSDRMYSLWCPDLDFTLVNSDRVMAIE